MNAILLAQLLKDLSDALNVAATRLVQAERAERAENPAPVQAAPVAAPVQAAPVQAAPVAPMTLAVTNADVVGAFQRLYQERGEGAVIECLRAVGVNRISDANAQQLAQLHATANAALDGAA